ncbi:MAG: TetR/AcrR family transcriptional regulator [Solirubrobacteraceae bacterium]
MAQKTSRTRRLASRGKDDVLRSAAAVIARRGVERTRFSDIAAETGLAVSTLQYIFGSRDDLINATFELTSNEELQALRGLAASIPDPLNRLRALAEFAVNSSIESWLVWLEFWRAAPRDPILLHTSRAVRDTWLATYEQAIHEARRSGAVRSDLDPSDMAILILGLIDGVYLGMILQDPNPDLDHVKTVIRHGVDSIVTGP